MRRDDRPRQPTDSNIDTSESLWRAIPDAIRGSHDDYTQIPLTRAIILLAVPMTLELVMQATFGLVDFYFVGTLGSAAVATVGLTEHIISPVHAIAAGLSMGATAMVARRIGEGKPDAAGLAAWQSILAGVIVAIPVSVGGTLLSRNLLVWMGGTEAIVAGYSYTAVLFAGSVTIFLLTLNNAIFRGGGDAAIALRALWLASIINIVLDPLLIFGIGPFPKLGLFGAALATTIGRGTGVAFQFAMLFRGNGRIKITRECLRWERAAFWRLSRVSVTGMVQRFVSVAPLIGITRIVALFGQTVLAGYTIGSRLIQYAILPSWGVSNAATTLVGQNLGAHKPQRAERAVLATGFVNFAMLGSIAILFWIFGDPLAGIFTSEEDVIAQGVEYLKILSTAYIFIGFAMAFVQAFNGSGDTATPAWINFFCFGCCEVPLAYFLAKPMEVGVTGVYWSIVICAATSTVIAYVLFRRGKWKEQTI